MSGAPWPEKHAVMDLAREAVHQQALDRLLRTREMLNGEKETENIGNRQNVQ